MQKKTEPAQVKKLKIPEPQIQFCKKNKGNYVQNMTVKERKGLVIDDTVCFAVGGSCKKKHSKMLADRIKKIQKIQPLYPLRLMQTDDIRKFLVSKKKYKPNR